jgi:hypothetical protein
MLFLPPKIIVKKKVQNTYFRATSIVLGILAIKYQLFVCSYKQFALRT